MTASSCLHRASLATLACLALLGAAPAHALGRLADIQVIDRDSGETLPILRHRGEYWVAGRPGARYSVSVRNTQAGRVMGVVAVDGVNVVSGETAGWQQTGYVLSPWQRYDIAGWRKSDSEIAAFRFTAQSASYAARTGRPYNVGVIGVAVFREKEASAAVAEPVAPNWRDRRELSEAERDQLARSAAPASPSSESAAAGFGGAANATADAAAQGKRAAPAAAPRLGTGHGEREWDQVAHTRFERRSPQPDEVIRIRYDSRENLVAMGVLPPEPAPGWPEAFPGSRRYVPDPQ
ncbi:hypothetical protein [Hydrogenophaga sp.]|uniref:hypothetical protein n=1 Tax=Hydrogenophaga sp. TaxID=1904254 RepID=UPI0035AE99BB